MHQTTAQLMDKVKKNSHVSNRALMAVPPHQPQNKLKGDSIKERETFWGEEIVKNANLRLELQPHKLIPQGLEFHFQPSYTFQLE
jgi:hypothetical protein